VRVTCQLIRVADDTHVWAERYDRVLEDIFAVQSEIAENVTRQLDVTLLDKERSALQVKSTENLAAYEAFLRGFAYLEGTDRLSKMGGQSAVAMFERAVELDPEFALAHARLSMAHSSYYFQGYDHTQERLTMAKEAIDRALELQPDLPMAHLAMGYYYYWGHRDYDQALEWFSKARKGLPNRIEVFEAIAYIQRRQGRFEESIENLNKAIERNPRNRLLLLNQGFSHTFVREYQEAERYFDRGIALAPDDPFGYQMKAWNLWIWKGDAEAARVVLEAAPANPDPMAPVIDKSLHWLYERKYRKALDRLSSLPDRAIQSSMMLLSRDNLSAQAHSLLGESEKARAAYQEARAFLESELRKNPEDARLHSALGVAYAGLGRKEEAIREGERALELLPVSRDATTGPFRIEKLALIYTMVGEYDAALDQIEYLLSIPSFFSVQILQVDPRLDPLREHPRYREIIEKYQ
jgi:tetratricopeptide (TPR) repeat protein